MRLILKARTGLVAKKVQVRGKSGKMHTQTIYVRQTKTIKLRGDRDEKIEKKFRDKVGSFKIKTKDGHTSYKFSSDYDWERAKESLGG